MEELRDFFQKIDKLERLFKRMPRTAGVIAVQFTKERFRAQNWVDNTTEPWAKRRENRRDKRSNKGRNLLTQSGRLRRSPRVIQLGADYVKIGSDVPYARAHNEGFRGQVKQAVKSFRRKLTKFGVIRGRQLKTRSNIELGRVQIGTTTVRAHQRTINQNIPRRQFMGTSIVLERQILRQFTADITKELR